MKRKDKEVEPLTAPFWTVALVATGNNNSGYRDGVTQYSGTYRTEADAKDAANRAIRRHPDFDVYVLKTSLRAIDPTPPAKFEDATK